MKRGLLICICWFFLLLSCVSNKSQESLIVEVESLVIEENSLSYKNREGKDYIRCWVNDSLLFSGIYRASYDSISDSYLGTDVAEVVKAGKDSVKIRVRLISLDSLLFAGNRIVDTTFFYRVDNIPIIKIVALRPFRGFDIYDPVSCPAAFEYE